MQRTSTQLERHAWQRGWRWSLMLHGLLVSSIIAQALWLPFPSMQQGGRQTILMRTALPQEQLELVVELAGDERSWMAREAESMSFEPVDVTDPRWQAILEEPFHAEDQATNAGNLLLQREIERSIAVTAARSNEANLGELGKRVVHEA